MKRLMVVGAFAPTLIVSALVLGAGAFAAAASAATLCVGGQDGCYGTLQAAVDAAHDGDTIAVGVGTFRGGITITKSLRLVGVAAGATVIRGGGPVVTIGEFEGANAGLRVALSRVTITGGVSDTPGLAQGGGVWIPQSAGQVVGATVTIDDSVVSGNRAAPKATFSSPAPCASVPFDECAFAIGGGIANAGVLTVTDSQVMDNIAGSPGVTSFASGGGISNGIHGVLTVRRSVVRGNSAVVSPPDGRSTEGGGINNGGRLVLADSVVDGNAAVTSSAVPSFFPFDIESDADAGGLDIGPHGTATITDTSISDNVVSAFDTLGDVQAINGGIDADGSFVMSGSRVDRNTVTAEVPAGSGFVAGAGFGGLGVHIGVMVTVEASHIGDNRLTSVSVGGAANVFAAGVGNNSAQLTIERTTITHNTGDATGAAGVVIGGGILNIASGGGPPQLTLTDSVVTANALTASAPLEPQGGGIYSTDIFGGGPFAVNLVSTVVEGNKPDQCVGGCK